MDAPEVEGLNVIGLIEPGGSGAVYRAEDGGGNAVALKLFDARSISRNLLNRMALRLAEGGWPEGVMPVLFYDFAGSPPTLVSPLQADFNDAGEIVPRSLQHRLSAVSGAEAWPVVKSIARALAAMHARRVAHGNLKPGNVFFDDDDEVLLADWTLGNIPGAEQFKFTDALLYQPVEQLRQPGGYLEEAGYRWDVFAFGVLAFRLLTGKFPRCDETFSKVAPVEGTTRCDNIRADLGKIAEKLEQAGEVVWPAAAENFDEDLCDWIEACLHLDPTKRPATMADVVAGFSAVEQKTAAATERDLLLDQSRRANRRAWRMSAALGMAAVLALMIGGGWYLASKRHAPKLNKRLQQIVDLRTRVEDAQVAKDSAESDMEAVKRSVDYDREVASARLEASRRVGDKLFSWAMEKGHRRLPPLDGRDQRLKSLERYFQDFLNRTVDSPALEEERAQVRVQLAEISLAAGDANLAIQRLGESLEAWKNLPMDSDQHFRMAKNRLLLALLLQSDNDPRMEAAFALARKELCEIPQTEVDADRLQQLLAILDFNEAKFLSAHGSSSKALEQLMTATQTLNRLADERPDSVVLRSELAGCYLSSATILEGMGNLGDAREVQNLAASEILKLLKQYPQDPALRFDLAGCYAGMAESAVLSGDIVNADSLSGESMKLLAGLIREQPDHTEAVARLASQIGLKAGLMRDRGETNSALKSFDEGIRLLESVRASNSGDALVDYRLALLWWQKGRILGMAGKRDEEVELIRRAHSTLIKLEAEKQSGGPPMEKIQSSTAYLLGDLGHALQMAGKKDEAKAAFAESVAFWERLLQNQPKSEEFIESLAWCRQRIKDLR